MSFCDFMTILMLHHQGLHMALSFLAPLVCTASKWVTGAGKTAWVVLKAPSVSRAPPNLHLAHREHWPLANISRKLLIRKLLIRIACFECLMKGVPYDLWDAPCSLFPQRHISQSEKRSEAGGLLRLPCWLFLSPLCHCQPQSVWCWKLFCKASSLTQDVWLLSLSEPVF